MLAPVLLPPRRSVAKPPPRSQAASAAPIEVVNAPSQLENVVMETAYKPFSFQRDQYIYFLWPRMHHCDLSYRLSEDGLKLFVQITQQEVPLGAASFAPLQNEITMSIPASTASFCVVLPHKCTPLGYQKLLFTEPHLSGIRLARASGVHDMGHDLK